MSNPVQDEDEMSQNSGVEGPDWMELIAPNAVYDGLASDFQYDDGGVDYDWSAFSYPYPSDLGKISLKVSRKSQIVMIQILNYQILN